MLIETIIPVLLPAIADGVRGVFNKLTGGAGAKPSNVGEVIQLMQAETMRLEALAKIDSVSSNVYPWVNSIRALQRPFACALIITGYLGAVAIGADASVTDSLSDYAQMVTFYIFGDRSYMYFKQGAK